MCPLKQLCAPRHGGRGGKNNGPGPPQPSNRVGQQATPIQGPGPGRERHDALCERNVYHIWWQYLEAGRVVACRWSTINFQDLLLKSSQIIVSHLLYLGNIPEIKKTKQFSLLLP